MDKSGEAPGDMGAMTGRLGRRMGDPSSRAPPRAVVPVRPAAATAAAADAALACFAIAATVAASAAAVLSAEPSAVGDVLPEAGSGTAAMAEVLPVAIESLA